ncbi:hypothetical protein J1N35_023590 [Gossypium stocksii]|uniref:Uncharacterized protein n=1 Tax=Gossypium stocksii TaxID=47602 RepID=A0A9D4A4J2_9ROSI|nr:hypothetical protein J1N35_023590 [Gossypium stocksii]
MNTLSGGLLRNDEIENNSRGGRCKTKGRTLLKDLYDLNSVERAKVSKNSHGHPIGSKARLLEGFLGIVARNANMLPINYESWHHMADNNKNQALDNIKEKLKDKRAEYEAIASSDSSVHLDDVDS